MSMRVRARIGAMWFGLLDAGRLITAERLIDGLYGQDPPGDAANALQSLVSRLRRGLARLGADHGNLLAALRWAVCADQVLALRLLATLSSYWSLRGLRSEGARTAAELLQVISPEPPAGREEEYALAIMIAVHGGAYGTGTHERLRTVDSIMVGLDGTLRPMSTLLWAMSAGPSAPHIELQKRLMAHDPWSEALCRFGGAYHLLFGGDVAGASAEFATCVTGFRAVGDRWGLSGSLAELARLTGWRGDPDVVRTFAPAETLIGGPSACASALSHGASLPRSDALALVQTAAGPGGRDATGARPPVGLRVSRP